METAEIVQTTVHDGSTDSVMRLCDMSGSAYRIPGLPTDSPPYTFSVWMKADVEMSVQWYVLGTLANTQATTDWVRVTVSVQTATDSNIDCLPGGDGNLYLHKAQLETGSIATDWTEAPEDVEETISGVQAGVDGNAENISDLVTWRSEAEMRMTDSAIIATVRQSAEYRQDQQNASDRLTDIENTVSSQQASLALLPGQIQAKVSRDELEKYFDFTAADGLVIGEGGSSLKTMIAPAEMRFEENGRPVLILKESRAILSDAQISGSMMIGGVYMRYNADTGHFSILRA